MPFVAVRIEPSADRSSRHARAFSVYGTLNRPCSSVDRGLALDADDLLQVSNYLDQVGLGGDDGLDVLVGRGDLVDHPGVLAGLDAGRLGDQVVDGEPPLGLVAAHPPARPV